MQPAPRIFARKQFEYEMKGWGFLGFWVLGFGFWVLGFGFWVLGFGFWVLGEYSLTRCENDSSYVNHSNIEGAYELQEPRDLD